MLPYCLLSWAGPRAPVYLLYTICRSLNGHVAPAVAASFQVSSGLWVDGKVLLMRDGIVR